jgi:ABC-type multidrug transport system fused ATPase/permease subunit
MNKSVFNNSWFKKNFIFLQVIFFLISIFEIFNIGLVVPFLYSLIDFENILSFKIFAEIIEIFKLDISNQKNFIIDFGLIIIVFFIVNSLLQIISLIFLSNFIEETGAIMQKKIFNKFMSLNYEDYTDSSSSNFYNLMISEIVRYQNGYLNSLININQKIYTLIILIIILSLINFFFVLIIASIFVILYLVFFIIFRKHISKISKEITKLNQKRISLLKSTFELFDLIQIKNLKNFFEKKLEYLILKIKTYNIKAFILASLPRQLVESFFVITIIVFSILVFKFGEDSLASKLQELILISVISVKLIPILNLIYNNYIKARANQFALINIETFLNFKTNFEKTKKEENLIKKNIIIDSDFIEISNLKFSYKEKNIFPKKNNKDYKIKMNQINLIYGESGSGKSTLIKILVGLIKPKSMTLKIKNKNYESINSNLSKVASYIPQRVHLYPSTIVENISLGDTKPNLNEIISCLKKSEIHEFSQSLRDSQNLILSEDLLDISGGQIQRIGLARALYDDTPIIILDETLSSVDDENKLKIMKTLEILSKEDKKTFIIITHDKTLFKENYNLIKIEK